MKKTLYVHRELLNGDDLVKWAKNQGFKNILDPKDMHVTIAFSREKVDWNNFGINEDELTNTIKLNRKVIALGTEGAVVLTFSSSILKARWKEFLEGGCSYDFPEYKSHVSITYQGTDIDLDKVKPYYGPLDFGPEIFKEVDLNWKEKVNNE